MPVDYSKWDALELSDDSDIEVHRNVDKRSFIRARQNQIHQERLHRKHEITTLQHERVINDALLKRIDALLSTLKAHTTAQITSSSSDTSSSKENDKGTPASADDLVFQAVLDTAGNPSDDKPPPRPEGVHTQLEEQPSYSTMMASLVDQVKKAVDEERKPKPEERLAAYVTEVGKHKEKVQDLQRQLMKRLEELQKQEGAKITSESIHTGFSSSHVAKATKEVELLNPQTSEHPNAPASSGSEADDPDLPPSTTTAKPSSVPSPLPTREIQPSDLGLRFAALPPNSYPAYLHFIAQNPSVLAERETDGLLMRAFDLEYANKPAAAKQSVHQALLLQYCRSLGKDGVSLFFQRIGTQGHRARTMFLNDVEDTYKRIRERTGAIAKDGVEGGLPDAEDDGGMKSTGGVEQIQLHAVNPGQKILIVTPSPPPEKDSGQPDTRTPEERQSWEVFTNFPPGLQRALKSGELDEVNKVLGKMSVEEGEETVGKLGESGMLSLEEGVIDATTEEGRREVEALERMGLEEQGGEGNFGGKDVGRVVEEVEDEGEVEKKAVDEVD